MKSQESLDYVVGVDVSKAKLDIVLPNETLTIENHTTKFNCWSIALNRIASLW